MVVHKIWSKWNPASADAVTKKPIPLTMALLIAVIVTLWIPARSLLAAVAAMSLITMLIKLELLTAMMDACRIPRKQYLAPNMVMMMTMTMTQSWNSSMTKQLEFTMWHWHYLNSKVLKSIPVPPRKSNCKSGCEKQEWLNQKTSDGASTSSSNKADERNGTLVAVMASLIQIQQGVSTPTPHEMRKTNYWSSMTTIGPWQVKQYEWAWHGHSIFAKADGDGPTNVDLDKDTNGDGTVDCCDQWFMDENKIKHGVFVVVVPLMKTRMAIVSWSIEGCPRYMSKTVAGICGCHTPNTDRSGLQWWMSKWHVQ